MCRAHGVLFKSVSRTFATRCVQNVYLYFHVFFSLLLGVLFRIRFCFGPCYYLFAFCHPQALNNMHKCWPQLELDVEYWIRKRNVCLMQCGAFKGSGFDGSAFKARNTDQTEPLPCLTLCSMEIGYQFALAISVPVVVPLPLPVPVPVPVWVSVARHRLSYGALRS